MRARTTHRGFTICRLLAAATILCASITATAQQRLNVRQSIAEIHQHFLTPPDDARPMVRWWWFGVAVEKPEILRELQQMKADGIGGAELAFVYPVALDDPARGLQNLTFLSPAMLDDVHYAQAEGRRLGLRIDATLCSGWPYGGPATTLAEAAGRRIAVVTAPPGYGKTTLLVDFAQSLDGPVCWYSLDERDVDPETFLRYFVAAGRADALAEVEADVVGMSCGFDVLAHQERLPALEAGEVLAFLDTGAYQDACASNFNGLPRPATVLVRGDAAEVVKRAETVADVFARDVIPERLR